MRKFLLIMLTFLLATSAAAETDLASMPTDDLVALRDSINHELALRSTQKSDAQIVDVDGILFSIDSVYTGTGNDQDNVVCIVFNVTNTTDASKQLIYDIDCDILQDGVPLEGNAFYSDTYSGPSPFDSLMATIAPGITNMKLAVCGTLVNDSDSFSIILANGHMKINEDPYRGMFSFSLNDYIQ